MKKKIWIEVTQDEYEFPIYICDTAKELAEKTGLAIDTIWSYTRKEKNKDDFQRIRQVNID